MERTWIYSPIRPGCPGRSAHKPRTISWMLHAVTLEARYSALDGLRVHQRIHLGNDPRTGSPARACSALAREFAINRHLVHA